MCNLYRMRSGATEVAQLFGVPNPAGVNFADPVYPGYRGLVVAQGELRAMTWGFPRRLPTMKPTSKPKAVTNARDDKLGTFFWRDSFERRRCLIPATAWAEPQGEPGRMTCTWHTLPGIELFAIAGLWRPTDEWGEAYTMVMVDSCAQMADVHDRMPVILRRQDWPRWTEGSPAEAIDLVTAWPEELSIEQTADRWGAR